MKAIGFACLAADGPHLCASITLRTAARMAVLVAALLLGGCYESATQVIDKGERAPLAGVAHCSSSFGGGSGKKIEEVSTGFWLWADYQYRNPDGESVRLKRLPNGLHLAQIASTKSKAFAYAFIDFPDQASYRLQVVDLTRQRNAVTALAKTHGVTAQAKGDGLLLLGQPRELLAFFSAHQSGQMTVILTCKRQ